MLFRSLKHLHGCPRSALLCRIERDIHFDCTIRERSDRVNDKIIVFGVCKTAGELIVRIGILVVGSPLLIGSLVVILVNGIVVALDDALSLLRWRGNWY